MLARPYFLQGLDYDIPRKKQVRLLLHLHLGNTSASANGESTYRTAIGI
jgi:hypothetical protein